MSQLETARLYLRPIEADDLDSLAEIFSDPDVMHYLPAGAPISHERANVALARWLEHWKKHGYGFWAALHKLERQMIGYCGLVHLEDGPEVELAYGFRKLYWGQGFATEAGRACLWYGFQKLGLRRIVGITALGNRASQRVLTKLGLKFEKEAFFYNMTCRYYCIEQGHASKVSPAVPRTP